VWCGENAENQDSAKKNSTFSFICGNGVFALSAMDVNVAIGYVTNYAYCSIFWRVCVGNFYFWLGVVPF